MSAEIIPFSRVTGEQVETAWAIHRALLRAEVTDPLLRRDPAHVRAREKALRDYDRLYLEWCQR